MKSKKWFKTILCMAAIASAYPASATIIDFEDLASQYELDDIGSSYSSQGYTFTYTPAAGEPYPTGLYAAGTSWIYNNGSTSLFANSDGAMTTLAQDAGQVFSLVSIDLAELNGPGATSILFEGTRFDGQLVYQTFYLDGSTGFEHFTFSNDFNAITSVSWQQGDNINFMPHMFDNVEATTVVPVPGAAALMLSALGVFGITFRRKTTNSHQTT